MPARSCLRNSARIEGSVIPGLDLRTFDLTEAEPAMRWLKGQPLLQTVADESPSVSDEEPADYYLVIDRGADLTKPALGGWLAPVEDTRHFVITSMRDSAKSLEKRNARSHFAVSHVTVTEIAYTHCVKNIRAIYAE